MSTSPRELLHFLLLSPADQATAIRKLRASGMSEVSIAATTRLSVEAVRRILAQGVA